MLEENMSATLDAIFEHRDFSYWPFALHRRVTRPSRFYEHNIHQLNIILDLL